ncbi:TonB-dependent receptor [Novosphingobium sp. NBM11]|uniref:TonB-dependent receptor n=1 Tax=Novosphingobium sp. NBM11 TaxID=2596914 RepID=UPI002101DEAC|nr:TonB-dependent receptor [Novosphingobium sp. NBM11]
MKTACKSRSLKIMGMLGASTFLTGLALPGTAFAEDQAAPAEQPADAAPAAGEGLGEIIVTATRSAQSIQKVPISMQALSADTLGQRQVKGLSDFATLLPSVSFAGLGPGRQTIYFRGIVPAGGNYASAGYYIDDIPITGTGSPDIHAYDLERVEALSGPQGTLYGAGSLAGTIRIITNKPKLGKFEFGAESEVNKYGKGAFGGQIQGYVNLPVTETVAVRAMAYYRRDGGYVDNTPNNGKFNDGRSSTLELGDNNSLTSYTLNNAAIAKKDYNPIYEYGGRLSLLWEPAPGWEVNPQVTAQRQIAYGYFGYDPRVGDLQVHDYDLTRQDDKWVQAQLSIHGHIGDFDVVSATGIFRRNTKLRNDYTYYTVTYDGFGGGYENYLQFFDKAGCTGSGLTLKCSTLINPTQYYHQDNNRNKFTQELRISTPKSWPFDLTIGGFYQSQQQENNNYYAIHGLDQIAGYTKAGAYSSGSGNTTSLAGFGIPTAAGGTMVVSPSAAVKGDGFYITENNQSYHDEAIFAEGHYKIFENLKLTGGIRYFWTDYKIKGFSGVTASALGVGCTVPLPAERLACSNQNPLAADGYGRYKEQGETHKVALDWQVTPTKMIYFNYSTGFRPGGYNRPLRIRASGGLPQVTVAAPAFKSETLTNFELGIKTTWNNIFRFNASIYLENWDNIQYGVVVAGAQGAGYTGNAGTAQVKGVEYDADLKLGKVTISTSGAYNDGKLTGNFCNFVADRAALSIVQLASCPTGSRVVVNGTSTSAVAAADGTRLPRQPQFKGTTSIRYDTTVGDYAVYLQGAALYQTSATQDLNVEQNNLLTCGTLALAASRTAAGKSCSTPGFVSFDFSGGLKINNWSFDVFIQNAFDKRGTLTTNTFCSITFCSGSSRNFTIRPQFFGLRAGVKY